MSEELHKAYEKTTSLLEIIKDLIVQRKSQEEKVPEAILNLLDVAFVPALAKPLQEAIAVCEDAALKLLLEEVASVQKAFEDLK